MSAKRSSNTGVTAGGSRYRRSVRRRRSLRSDVAPSGRSNRASRSLSEGAVRVNTQAAARNGRGSPAAAPRQDSSERTIFYNGKVFTSVSGALWAQGVVVSGRTIVAVGTNDEVLAYRDPHAAIYNLEGRVLVPGFNDAHVHPVRPLTAYPRAARVNDARDFVPGPGPSTAEMLDLIANAAAATPPGTWLFGAIGAAVLDDSAADRFAIDARVSGHPVMLFAWTGHGAIFNSVALATVGIGEQEPDPFGGFYERVNGTKIVNGVAHEYAAWRMFRYFFDRMTDEELIAAYQGAAAAAASFGYTSIQEFPIGLDHDRFVRVLDAADIRVRWRAACFPLSIDENCRATASNPLIDAGGIKWIADGTPIERLAALNQGYVDDPNNTGRYNFTEDVLAGIRRSQRLGPAASPTAHDAYRR